MRLQFDSKFEAILSRMRNSQNTEEDIEILSSRLSNNLSFEELENFKDAVNLLQTNQEVDEYIETYLSKLNIPLKAIRPVVEPLCEECMKKFPTSYLGKGVKCFVTRNICSVRNILNGTNFVVENLYFVKDSDKLPAFITLKIKDFHGNHNSINTEDKNIPLGPSTEHFFALTFSKRSR